MGTFRFFKILFSYVLCAPTTPLIASRWLSNKATSFSWNGLETIAWDEEFVSAVEVGRNRPFLLSNYVGMADWSREVTSSRKGQGDRVIFGLSTALIFSPAVLFVQWVTAKAGSCEFTSAAA